MRSGEMAKKKKKRLIVLSYIEKYSEVDRVELWAQGHPGLDLITTT